MLCLMWHGVEQMYNITVSIIYLYAANAGRIFARGFFFFAQRSESDIDRKVECGNETAKIGRYIEKNNPYKQISE